MGEDLAALAGVMDCKIERDEDERRDESVSETNFLLHLLPPVAAHTLLLCWEPLNWNQFERTTTISIFLLPLKEILLRLKLPEVYCYKCVKNSFNNNLIMLMIRLSLITAPAAGGMTDT